MTADIPFQKKTLRLAMAERRNALPDGYRFEASRKIVDFADELPVVAGNCVAVYMPVRSEVDCLPLAQVLEQKGCRLALPVVLERGKPMIFRRFDADTVLHNGVFGIPEPTNAAVEEIPDIWLMPLLAFDRTGGRLGYGGGYYDRTAALFLRKKGILLAGMAFAEQEVAHVPVVATDVKLNIIMTENEVIRING